MGATPSAPMFHEPPKERNFPTTAVAIAAVAVLLLVTLLLVFGRHRGQAIDTTQPQPPAPYASNLEISDIKLSESTSLSGGKSTYIDGHITNKGTATVTGITVQVAFPNDVGQPPQLAAAPLQVVRIREPEVDTQPMSSAPLTPGATADFRLIFENVDEKWNSQQPEMRAIVVDTK